jgi:hypothetical protein
MPIPNVERRERRYNLRLRQSRQVERRLLRQIQLVFIRAWQETSLTG